MKCDDGMTKLISAYCKSFVEFEIAFKVMLMSLKYAAVVAVVVVFLLIQIMYEYEH